MRILERLNNFMRGESAPASATVVAESAAAAFFKASAIETALTYKANALAMSEFKVYENGEEVKNTLWYELNYAPNPNQSASELWGHFMHNLCMRGEALMVIVNNCLYVADSWAVEEHDLGQHVYTGVTIGGEQLRQRFRAGRVFYFRMNDANIATAVSGALEAYSSMMAKAMSAYEASCGTKYKVVLERRATGDAKSVEEQQAALAANLKTFIDNANAVYMETNGQRLETVKSDTAVEPEHITALRKDIYDSAAMAFKIPRSVMYGDMTNIGDIVNVMLTFAVDPDAKMISREFTRKQYTEEEVRGGCRVHVDTSTVKHTDLFDIAPDAMNLISSGTMTVDDLLVALGREPENTPVTSQRWMTKNIGRIEDVLAGDTAEGGDNNA